MLRRRFPPGGLRILGALALLFLTSVAAPMAARAVDVTPVQQTVVLVMDTSGSMQGARLTAAQSAARRFISEVPAVDPIALITFSAKPTVRVRPTLDRTSMRTAVDGLQAGGDTALFDAVATALTVAPANHPCTILLLADGQDTTSRATLDTASADLRASACTLNAVALRPSAATLSTLEGLAAAGRGTAYRAYDAAGITGAFLSTLQTPTASPSASAGTLATTPPSPAPSAEALATATSPGLLTSIGLLLLGLVTAGGILGFVLLALEGSNRAERRRMERLIASYAIRRVAPQTEPERTLLEAIEDAVAPLLRRRGYAERLTVLLDGASVNRSAEQWTLIRVAAAGGATLLFTALTGALLPALVASVPLGLGLPQLWLRRRRAKRSRHFEAALPDALMLIASSLRSGFALDQAIVAAAEQADNEVAAELRRALQEVRIGVPIEDALERAAIRIDSADFRWVVTALRIQRRSGGNLAQLLVTVSKTVRQRAELGREVKALTAEGRMSAYVLMALPIGLFLFLLATRPGYLAPLWQTPTGLLLMAIAGAMLLVGWLIMQRMIKVDV